MIPYLILFTFCIVWSYFADKAGNYKKKAIFLTFCAISMILIGGFRDLGVGTDTLVYAEDYMAVAEKISLFDILTGNYEAYDFNNNIDKGYLLLCHIATYIMPSKLGGLLFPQILTIGLLYLGAFLLLKEMRYSLAIFSFVICFMVYQQTFNYMRQFCAVSILFVGYYYFIKKEYVIYLLLQFIAYFFHSSSLMFLIVPVLYVFTNGDYGFKLKMFVTIILIITIIISYLNFYTILEYVVAYSLLNDSYGERYGIYSTYDNTESYSRMFILLNCLPFFIYVYGYFKKIINAGICLYGVLLNFIYIVLYALGMYISFLMRLSLYFFLVGLLYTTIVLSSKKCPRILTCFYLFLVIYCWYKMYILGNACETYPYSSSFWGF